MTKLSKFITFLTVYAELYRNRYNQTSADPVSVGLLVNNESIPCTISESEPTPVLDNLWVNQSVLKVVVDAEAIGDTRYLTVVDEGTAEGTVAYNTLFTTNIVFLGEYIDQGIPTSEQPVYTDQSLGKLLVHNGVEFIEFNRGSDGYSLVVDSTSPTGLRWQPFGADDGDISYAGDWVGTAAYRSGDVVKYDGSTYVSVSSNQDKEPPDLLYWAEFVSRGDPGVPGAQGAQGPQGDPGLVWTASWQSEHEYSTNDAILVDGSAYICVSDHTSGTTLSVTTDSNWSLFCGGLGAYTTQTFTIGPQDVQAGRLVIVNDSGGLEYADSTALDHRFRIVGLTKAAGVSGEAVSVVLSGVISGTEISPGSPIWNWVMGAPIFLGSSGMLTQEIEQEGVVRAFQIVVGTPVSTNSMKIMFHPPYLV